MQREHKFLPLAIALVAGLAVSIVFILNHNNSITSVLIVLAVMLGFYIVGLIFRAVLVRLNTKEPEEGGIKETEGQTICFENMKKMVLRLWMKKRIRPDCIIRY